MRSIDRLEKKYGIKIEEYRRWIPSKREYVKCYKMYSADGHLWDDGLDLAGIKHECGEWGQMLVKIKRRAEVRG